MELGNIVRANTRTNMDTINILADDARKLAAVLELNDGHVAECGASEMERSGL